MEKEQIIGLTAKKAKDGRPRTIVRDVPADVGNIIDSLLISNPGMNAILDVSQQEFIKRRFPPKSQSPKRRD